MDRLRCPRCGFSYAWDGEYCDHCRSPVPGRKHWDRFQYLASFHRVAPTERQWILFTVGCLRRYWHLLADFPLVQLIEAVERYTDEPAAIAEVRSLTNWLLATPHARTRGPRPDSPPGSLSEIIVNLIGQWLGGPQTVESMSRQAASAIRTTVAAIELPQRDRFSFDLPPTLEP